MGVWGWLGDQASSAGEAIGDAANATVDAVGDAASATWNAVGEAAGTVRDEVGSVFGFDTRAENAQQEQAAAAEKQGQQLRDELAQRNQQLDTPAGYDPASISQQENWQSYGHRQIYDTNQNTLSQSDAAAVAEAWRNIGKKLGEIGDRLESDSAKAIDSGWSGEAAEAAKQSAQPLAKWSRGSGECFRLTGNKIEEAGSAAGQVKAMVPEPQDHDVSQTVLSGLATGGFGAGADALRQMHERQQEERKAQETMDRVMGATYRNVDTTVPAYRQLDGKKASPPDSKPDGPGTAGIPPGTGPGGGTGGYSGGGGTGTAGYPGGGYSGSGSGTGQGGGSGWDGGRSQQPGGSGTGPLPGGGSSAPPSGSESAWATPPSAGGAGAGAGGPGAGGAAGGAGAGGGAVAGGYAGGAPGGAGSGSGPGAGGRSGTGAVKSGGGPAAGGGSAAGSAGRGGGGARGPMGMGGGQRGQGGEEEEHERPSWLEEWDDVWFNDMPRTAPPVIE